MKTLYFGVYRLYQAEGKPKVAQLVDSIDSLSCEILADPGVIRIEVNNELPNGSITRAFELAKQHSCDQLNIDLFINLNKDGLEQH